MGVGRHARCVYGLIAVEIAASIVLPTYTRYRIPRTYRMAGSHVTRDNVNLYKVINEFINELYEFMTSRPCAGVSCDIVGTRPPPARPPPRDPAARLSPCRPPLSPSPAPPPGRSPRHHERRGGRSDEKLTLTDPTDHADSTRRRYTLPSRAHPRIRNTVRTSRSLPPHAAAQPPCPKPNGRMPRNLMRC